MRLVWHIIWKDLRRMRWLLALWGGVILLQYAAWRAAAGELKVGSELGVTDLVIGLWVLPLVFAWLLVPQLLQDDPLRDPSAAWQTRPISGGRLLAAKVGGMVLMLCLWPSLMTVPWWLEFGFGFGEIVRAVAVNTFGMTLFTGLALMVAVITDGWARYIAWSIALEVGAALGWLLLAVGVLENGEGTVSAAVLMTRASLACSLALVTAAIVVPWQFLTRRTAVGRGLVIAMVVGVALIVQFWPWTMAEVKTKLGGRPAPTVTARIVEGTVALAPAQGGSSTGVRVTTEFELKGLGGGDVPSWGSVDPTWRVGERRLKTAAPWWLSRSPLLVEEAAALVRGQSTVHDLRNRATWDVGLSAKLWPELSRGDAAVAARYAGSIWHGELGPVVPLREGASGARGWEQIHVRTFTPGRNVTVDGRATGGVSWWQTVPLFESTVVLEMMNPDSMTRHRMRTAILLSETKARLDESPFGDHRTGGNNFRRGRIPVGLLSVAALSSEFYHHWRGDSAVEANELMGEGSRLASVTFQEAAPLRAELAETPFAADFVIEGRMDDALRRAKAEGKPVLVRVSGKDSHNPTGVPYGWGEGKVRKLLAEKFVCLQVAGEEAARLRKRTDEPGASVLVVLKPSGVEQDRWRDLHAEELPRALHAVLDGKTYAAVLMERLAERGGDDRYLRFQLHEALRERGDLAGAFDAILWMVDHGREAEGAAEVYEVGSRLQRFVATYGSAKDSLLVKRSEAVAALRRDGQDASAARRLFVITLGLKHDDVVWREFPRLIPRENPWWWEYVRLWIGASVTQKRYREVVEAVELEKFFAEGPTWMRAQLLARRSLDRVGQVATAAEWETALLRTGTRGVEALVGAGQDEVALRLAGAVLKVNGSPAMRERLATVMTQAGAKAEVVRRLTDKDSIYGR